MNEHTGWNPCKQFALCTSIGACYTAKQHYEGAINSPVLDEIAVRVYLFALRASFLALDPGQS
jgi:hypothetical protein